MELIVKKVGIFLLASCVSLSAMAETHTYNCGPSLTSTGYGAQVLEFDVYRDHTQRVDMQLIYTEKSHLALNNQLLYTIVETSGVTPKLINKIKLLCGYIDNTPYRNEQDVKSIISVPAKAWTCESWDNTVTCTAPD